jgi:hypothetical protein
MGYVLTAAIVLVVAFAVAGALHVHHQTRPADRSSRVVTSTVVRRARSVTAGDHCLCGGTIGRIADQSGALLGCTGCDRLWTLDGRKINKIVRR